MAKQALRDVENFTYVLAEDRKLDIDEQSTFRFRPLSQPERMKALDGMEVVRIEVTGERQIKPCGMQQAYDAVLTALVGVDNFPTGEVVPFPADAGRDVRAKYLERLSDSAIYELGMYVIDRSTLGPPEKNS